jgi:hypothetical protein
MEVCAYEGESGGSFFVSGIAGVKQLGLPGVWKSFQRSSIGRVDVEGIGLTASFSL